MIENSKKEVASKDFEERFEVLQKEEKIISNAHIVFAKTEEENTTEALVKIETDLDGLFNTVELLINVIADRLEENPSKILAIIAMKKMAEQLGGSDDDSE